MVKARKAKIERKTRETQIRLLLNLDGTGKNKVDIPVKFMNHLLASFAQHALIDLELQAQGDLQIDEHHTVEDLGIVLGQALAKALGDKKGINRFGCACVPMDEALARVALDFSGRPFLNYQVEIPKEKEWEFNLNLVPEFLRALVNNAGLTLHVKLESGADYHHSLEAVFKALGRAVSQAVSLNPRLRGLRAVPSTKGSL